MMRAYEIGGMHCDACAERIRAQVESIEGISSAQLGYEDAILRVEVPEDLSRDILADAVSGAGDYSLGPEIQRGSAGDPGGAGSATSSPPQPGAGSEAGSYTPLAILVGYMLLFALAPWIVSTEFSLSQAMGRFMAAFFFAFSFFKMLDLRGFAHSYRRYDVIAQRVPAWAWVYPFVELALGFAFLTGVWPIPVYLLTLAVMGVGGYGVWRTVRKGQHIRCACLGTVIPLPLGTVTLIEDFGMAAMALIMLALRIF